MILCFNCAREIMTLVRMLLHIIRFVSFLLLQPIPQNSSEYFQDCQRLSGEPLISATVKSIGIWHGTLSTLTVNGFPETKKKRADVCYSGSNKNWPHVLLQKSKLERKLISAKCHTTIFFSPPLMINLQICRCCGDTDVLFPRIFFF